jgi:hypothetical protein
MYGSLFYFLFLFVQVCLLHIDLAGVVQLKQSKLQLYGTDFEPGVYFLLRTPVSKKHSPPRRLFPTIKVATVWHRFRTRFIAHSS